MKAMNFQEAKDFVESHRARIARAFADAKATSPLGMPLQLGSLAMFVPPQPEFGGMLSQADKIALDHAREYASDNNTDI